MRKLLLTSLAAVMAAGAFALEPVKLNAPDLERGKSLMKSLSERQSVREYADRELSLQDLSDLLWAANGVNRPNGKRTAPSAMDKRDISLYVATAKGTYRYDAEKHSLEPIREGDYRQKMRGNTPAINILVVADDGSASYADVDAGYVSQNIYLACTSLGMGTVAAGSMDREAFNKACNLSPKQLIVVQHPVGYLK